MTRLYTANPKQWDHTGFVYPEVEHSESLRPAAELKPADWLPVVRYEKKMEDWVVIMPGKVIAVDRTGRVVPAGLAMAFEVAAGTTVLTYTANDYSEQVVDLTTGVAYATNGTTTYTQTQVTTALRNRGLIRATEYARDFIQTPIGYAPYAMYKWCGGDGSNPANFVKHNYNRQSQVAAGCDYVLQIPIVPTQQATETMGDGSIDNAASAVTFGTTQWVGSTKLHATTRYASLVAAGANVVGYVFGRYPVAKITDNTAITDSLSALAAKTEVASIAAVVAGGSGYFYVDYEAGVLFVFETDGNAVPSPFVDGTTTVTYYHYETNAAGAANIAQVLGDVNPGDWLTFDANSNFVKATVDIGTAPGDAITNAGEAHAADPDYDTDADATISAQLEHTIEEAVFRTVGQCIAVWVWPRSGLEKVRTQFETLSSVEKMAGSATNGHSDSLNVSGGANRVAIINFNRR